MLIKVYDLIILFFLKEMIPEERAMNFIPENSVQFLDLDLLFFKMVFYLIQWQKGSFRLGIKILLNYKL